MPGAAIIDDAHVIANDVGLMICAVIVGDLFAIKATRDFPFSGFDLSRQGSIINNYVTNQFVVVLSAAAADVLHHAFDVRAVIR